MENGHRIGALPALVLGCVLASGPASAFDCSKAVDRIDQAICADPQLRAGEDSLEKAFFRARRLLGSRTSLPLLDEQRGWIGKRRTDCAAKPAGEMRDCLRNSTAHRERELSRVLDRGSPGPAFDLGDVTLTLTREGPTLLFAGGVNLDEAWSWGFRLVERSRNDRWDAVVYESNGGGNDARASNGCVLLVSERGKPIRHLSAPADMSEGCSAKSDRRGLVFESTSRPGEDGWESVWSGGETFKTSPGREWAPEPGGTLPEFVRLARASKGTGDSALANEEFWGRLRRGTGDDWRNIARALVASKIQNGSPEDEMDRDGDETWRKRFYERFIVLAGCGYGRPSFCPSPNATALIDTTDMATYFAVDPKDDQSRTYPERSRWPEDARTFLEMWNKS